MRSRSVLIIALFNLKPGITAQAYEDWARSRDLPGLRSLVSVNDFNIYRTTGVVSGDAAPAHGYIGILDIAMPGDFAKDSAGELFTTLSRELADYADDVAYMTTEPLSTVSAAIS
jgi:hypothetical protein